MTDKDRPSKTFPMTVNGEARDIEMSFGLFQEIMKVVPQPENVASLLISDFYLREYVIRRMLTGRKRVKEDSDMVDLIELDLDSEDVDGLVLWVTDHILYFFTTTAEKSLSLGKKYADRMEKVTLSLPSQTGSKT